MNLSSFKFIGFVLIFLFLYLIVSDKYKKYILIIAGISFYLTFNIYGVIYLLLVSIPTYYICKDLNKTKMIFLIFLILSSLIFFKSNNLYSIVGISFISFKLISYIVDIYNKKISSVGFLDFLVYISFFPVISAGPIVRYNDFKFEKEISYASIKSGFFLFLLGIFVKLVVVHRISEITNIIYKDANLSSTYYLLAVFLYSFEIYFDFDAYSNMAIGISRMFGYELKDNFKTPYFSKNMSEFYRRWHISLSFWFKDYVYIPIGGYNHRYFNIMVVSVLSGLWHGFSITCLIWGVYHGLIQIINHRLKYKSTIITFLLVSLGWIFFKSSSISEAGLIFNKIFSFNYTSFSVSLLNINILDFNVTITLLLGMIVLDYFRYRFEVLKWFNARGFIFRWFVYISLIFLFLLFGRYGIDYQASDFIYQSF